jgi:hypothetical protein
MVDILKVTALEMTAFWVSLICGFVAFPLFYLFEPYSTFSLFYPAYSAFALFAIIIPVLKKMARPWELDTLKRWFGEKDAN